MKIEEGQEVPLGYGFAWFEYDSREAVVFFIPFNFIFRWVRSFYFFISRQGSKNKFKEYQAGYRAAKEFYEKREKLRDEEWSRTVGLAILAEREKLKVNPPSKTNLI